MLLFRHKNGELVLDQKASSKFYGFHTYLRGKDFDGDRKSDLLIRQPGRLLFFRNGRWVNALPLIEKQIGNKIDPIGWIDADVGRRLGYSGARRSKTCNHFTKSAESQPGPTPECEG